MKKYLLRCRLSYGESKRAGNGWRVCRTRNFSFTRKIAGARAYWGRHIEKRRVSKLSFFLCACVRQNLVFRAIFESVSDYKYFLLPHANKYPPAKRVVFHFRV